ncbi:uncharacterized protein LOC127533173 [Acanthochromis polyacanthus]|uniref:uncharacterized protein LOC127533173 n=1 Tax=Acanthochromis polyacanthus TaxID=80966 RepID=UPI0022341E1D|nr:uncharacterized protein LOC127533173 [Acanthochromis polyacanthus]
MKPEARREFMEWYETVRRGIFNFKQEALYYCQNDVDVLAEGCMIFRNGYIEETGVDPLPSNTIASTCMKTFACNFLQPKTLAIPSPDHYTRQYKSYSHASIQWLEWVSRDRGVFIQHALNAGEKRLGRYFVDGYSEAGGVKYVWEFLGCFYHDCPSCFQPHETCSLTGRSFGELHCDTMARLNALESKEGVKVVLMREHSWDEMKKSNPSVRAFLQDYRAPEPLHPRQALYGGRTCAVRLRYSAAANESVEYADVTSLYPYVNCSFPYPLGHPKIIHTAFNNPQSYFGFIRAVVYPPRGLFSLFCLTEPARVSWCLHSAAPALSLTISRVLVTMTMRAAH